MEGFEHAAGGLTALWISDLNTDALHAGKEHGEEGGGLQGLFDEAEHILHDHHSLALGQGGALLHAASKDRDDEG